MKLSIILISLSLLLSSCIKTTSYRLSWYVKNESGKDLTISFPFIGKPNTNKIAPGDSLELCGSEDMYVPYRKAKPRWDRLFRVVEIGHRRPVSVFLRIKFESDNNDDGKLILYKEWTPDNPNSDHDFFNESEWVRYDSGYFYDSSPSTVISPLHKWVFSVLPEDLKNAEVDIRSSCSQ